jgi:hypothetical protein
MRLQRCFSLILFLALALGFAATSVHAADWMFERSYYTHTPVQPIQVGPQPAPGSPYYSRPQGAYTSSGLRQLRSTIRVGNMIDNYYQWDGYIQRGVQY